MEYEAKVKRHTANRPTHVSLDDAAVQVMTDLSVLTPYSIDPSSSINAANDKMVACGVRLLFVTEENGDLAGIVTSTDILGEKPIRIVTEQGGSRQDITTRDVMTHKSDLQVINMSNVDSATVGDIVETMKAIGRQHTLVVETDENGKEFIRGIFSTSQIQKQTGTEIFLSRPVNTFAEAEKAVRSA